MEWPLLGFGDPEEVSRPLTAPAERVALVAFQKEKRLLQEAAAKASRAGPEKSD